MSAAGIFYPRLSHMADSRGASCPRRINGFGGGPLDTHRIPEAPKTPPETLHLRAATLPRNTVLSFPKNALLEILPTAAKSSRPRCPPPTQKAILRVVNRKLPVLDKYQNGANLLQRRRPKDKLKKASFHRHPAPRNPHRPPIPHPPGLTGRFPHSPSIPAAISVTRITRHGVNGCGWRGAKRRESSAASRWKWLRRRRSLAGAAAADGRR